MSRVSRRFTVGGSGKSVARCHRTVLAYWKFESISLQRREAANFRFRSIGARMTGDYLGPAGDHHLLDVAKP